VLSTDIELNQEIENFTETLMKFQNVDMASDFVISYFLNKIESNNYNLLDELFLINSLTTLHFQIPIAMLMITKPVQDKFTNRTNFKTKLRENFVENNKDEKSIEILLKQL